MFICTGTFLSLNETARVNLKGSATTSNATTKYSSLARNDQKNVTNSHQHSGHKGSSDNGSDPADGSDHENNHKHKGHGSENETESSGSGHSGHHGSKGHSNRNDTESSGGHKHHKH